MRKAKKLKELVAYTTSDGTIFDKWCTISRISNGVNILKIRGDKMVKELVAYTTSDGTIFDKWCDASAYEKNLYENKNHMDEFVWDVLPELNDDIKKLISMRLRDNLHKLTKIHN